MSVGGWIAVALLGGVGAIGRFLLDSTVSRRTRSAFPFGTLAVNLSGALVLGLLTGLGVSGTALVLAGTATVGAYTTFSTWMLETHRLAEDGNARGAVLNVGIGVIAGVAAALLGRTIGVHA